MVEYTQDFGDWFPEAWRRTRSYLPPERSDHPLSVEYYLGITPARMKEIMGEKAAGNGDVNSVVSS